MLPAASAHLRSSCRQQRPALHRTARPLLHAGPDLDQSTDTGYCRRGAGRVAARVNGPTAAPAIRFGHAQQGICAATHQPAGRLTRLPSRRGVQRRSGRCSRVVFAAEHNSLRTNHAVPDLRFWKPSGGVARGGTKASSSSAWHRWGLPRRADRNAHLRLESPLCVRCSDMPHFLHVAERRVFW